MRKRFKITDLDTVAIAGVGLLGGSIGLALRAAGFTGRRIGIGRRLSSLRRARQFDAVDEITRNPARAAADAQLVILCAPISQFEVVLQSLAPALPDGCMVTDVASAKEVVVRLAGRLLPPRVQFVGSHPMAGSEKSGVEYARADLFDRATCIVTPTPTSTGRKQTADTGRTEPVEWISGFWETLGARTVVLSPREHDELLARISHLPHAVASALVALGRRDDAMRLAGPGFADTTRIASGDPAMWTDIFRANRAATLAAIDELIVELQRFRKLVQRDDASGIQAWLESSQQTRDRWIAQRYRKKVLPP